MPENWPKLAHKGTLPTEELAFPELAKVLVNLNRFVLIQGSRHQPEAVQFILRESLARATDPLVAVRKPAVYALEAVVCQVERDQPGALPAVCGDGVLDWAEGALCDPGTDLDERGRPLAPKGTLTLAERAWRVLRSYPKAESLPRAFHGSWWDSSASTRG